MTIHPKEVEINYNFCGLRCFQFLPKKAIAGYWPKPDLILVLMDGFSIEINTGPQAIAFNEIQFKHSGDPSLSFELPMGLVEKIYDYYDEYDERLGTKTDFNFRFAKTSRPEH